MLVGSSPLGGHFASGKNKTIGHVQLLKGKVQPDVSTGTTSATKLSIDRDSLLMQSLCLTWSTGALWVGDQSRSLRLVLGHSSNTVLPATSNRLRQSCNHRDCPGSWRPHPNTTLQETSCSPAQQTAAWLWYRLQEWTVPPTRYAESVSGVRVEFARCNKQGWGSKSPWAQRNCSCPLPSICAVVA